MQTDGQPKEFHVTLSPADAEALEAVMSRAESLGQDGKAAGRQTTWNHLPPDLAQRAGRADALIQLIRQCPAEEPSDDLVRRTLDHVAQVRQRERFAQQAQSLAMPAVAFRWSELIAVAAVLLISLSLVWPALERSRDEARRAACAGNLADAGVAISQYGADNAGMMPRGKTRPNSPWGNTGKKPGADGYVESNSYNLFLLSRRHYLNVDTLACPGNPDALLSATPDMVDWATPETVSYSYQNQYTAEPISLDDVRDLALMADKNPLFTGPIYNRDLMPTSPSDQHGRVGQNILNVAGNVLWSSDPLLRGDNIWLPQGVDPADITGRETPANASDSFLP
jgi:hypothetical protein